MLKFLNKPYPFNDDLKHNTKLIFFVSLCVFAFLYLFQPLKIDQLEMNDKFYLMIGIGVITFLGLSINLLLLPSLIPRIFLNSEWNIKREIIWNLWILFTISVSYFFYNKWLHLLEFDFYLIINLILIAVVPITALIVINYNRILRSNLLLANEINKKLQDNKFIDQKVVFFRSDYLKDSLEVKVSQVVFIRSANNYIEVFWWEDNRLRSQMVRCSLAKAEELLKEEKFIFKCHRSYLVNIKLIEKIEGNPQGYKLFFNNVDFSIPVSKNFAHKLRQLI
jgi:hypothetical protein